MHAGQTRRAKRPGGNLGQGYFAARGVTSALALATSSLTLIVSGLRMDGFLTHLHKMGGEDHIAS